MLCSRSSLAGSADRRAEFELTRIVESFKAALIGPCRALKCFFFVATLTCFWHFADCHWNSAVLFPTVRCDHNERNERKFHVHRR